MNTKRIVSTWLAVLSMLLASCTAAPTPESSPVATQPPTAQATPTTAPSATPTLAPTPTPAPIECTLAFDTDRDGNWEVYRMAPDGSQTINLTNDSAEDIEPAWSPDGRQIAFASNRATDIGGGQYIYVMNADGSGVRRLTQDPDSRQPDWSHDGSRILYASGGDIFVIAADGSAPAVNLTSSPENDTAPKWSLDDQRMAWLSGNGDQQDVLVMNLNGSDRRQLTNNGRAYRVEWTVDGQIFANWDQPEGICMNCLIQADGSGVSDAGGKGDIQRYLPFWTLDGNRVEVAAVNVFTPDNEIFLVSPIYPDVFLNLTNNPANDRNPDWPANCGPGLTGGIAAEAPTGPMPVSLGYAGDIPAQPQRKSNFERACGELGVECRFGTLSQLVDQGTGAIVLNTSQTGVGALRPELQRAVEKGIPVFVLDAEIDMDGVYSVTINHGKWMATALEWMMTQSGGQGQMAYFDLDPSYRYAGLLNDLLSKFPNMQVVERREGDYDPAKVKPETVDFATRYPGLKAVWTASKMSEAMRGLLESNLPPAQWPLINCEATLDGLETWQTLRQTHPGFQCIAVANPPGIAYDAAYAAYTVLNGASILPEALDGEYGRSLIVEFPVITNDTLQEWLDRARAENTWEVDQVMAPETIREVWFGK